MKYAKKFTSMLLVLVMALSLAIPAFAADETGTITINNPQADETYTAYKIFDVTYSTEIKDGTTFTHYAYTIQKADDTWFNDVITYMGQTWNETDKVYDGDAATADATTGVYTGNGITLTPSASAPTVYVVEINEKAEAGKSAFSAPDFARFLKTKIESKSGKSFTVSGGKATATGLELGYYFVASTTGALCNLTTTSPSVTIRDKNEVVFDKTADDQSVELGQVVHYTLKSKAPGTSGYEDYIYTMSDTMSEGLTFNTTSVHIYLSDDDEFIAETTDGKTVDQELAPKYYEKTDTIKDSVTVGFTIDFKAKDMDTAGYAEKYIFVTYSAKVNDEAVTKISPNKATLTYSNDPTDWQKTGTQEDHEDVYSARIVIDKYAANPNDATDKSGAKLEGAKFVLMNSDKTKYYYCDETKREVTWNALAEGETLEDVLKTDYPGKTKITAVTTNASGAAQFDGLEDGKYFLFETAAPKGYNLLNAPVEISIEGTKTVDGMTTIEEAQLTQTAYVANNTGAELPDTGGMGTTIFYVVGSILLVGAAVLLITKKRMSSAK